MSGVISISPTAPAAPAVVGRTQCVYEMFEAQASDAGTPEAIAVEAGDEQISYGDLNRRANRLAHRLIAAGVGPETIVGMRMPRSTSMIVCMLATMKAGAAYLPLDPDDSSSRAQGMIEASGMSLLLTAGPGDAGAGSRRSRIVQLATLREQLDCWPDDNPRVCVDPANLAYVMYTSGSTGAPKGVAMPHASVANLISWHRHARHDTWGLRTLQFCSPEFDFSFHEIFSTLCSGGTLVMAGEEARYDPRLLALTIRDSRVEKVFLPVSVLLRWAEALEPATVPPRLRCVVTTGERLRITKALRAAFKTTGAVLHNHYGATEFQDATSWTLAGDADAWPYEPPAGLPIANVAIHVWDEQLRPVSRGDVGQIYISGAGLARGYIGNPEFTAARFFAGAHDGNRVYATGDLGWVRPDGVLVHLGRRDSQIKLAGRRVELGEIERAIAEQHGVGRVFVTVRRDPHDDLRLVGYVAADRSDGDRPQADPLRLPTGSNTGVRMADASASSLRAKQSERELVARIIAAARARLPSFMVPRDIVVLQEFPLTRNGKVDVAALPDPEPRSCDAQDRVAPRDTVEERLAAIWSEALALKCVGVHDNFFELGGDSIAAVRVASRARALGFSMTAYDLFHVPTIASLAAKQRRADPRERALELRSESFGPTGRQLPAAPHTAIEKSYRLTGLQEGLLFHDLEDPTLYVVQRVFRIVGPLDLQQFRLAWEAVACRHEALRTAVRWQDVPQPVQVVHRRVQVPWHYEDWRALPAAEQIIRQAAYLRTQRQRGLAIDTAPLLRVSAFRCADDRYRLIVAVHHIVMDGWSWEIVLAEVLECYRAAIAKATPSLPHAPSYEAYVQWLRAQDGAAARQFWCRALRGLSTPTRLPRADLAADATAAPSALRGQRSIELSVELSSLTKLAARQMHVTINTLCQAVWALVLARHGRQAEVLFGAVVSGRSARLEGAESVVGLLANTIPVRTTVRPGEPVAGWLRELQRQQAEARVHEYASLADIHRWSELPADQAMFESITVHESYAHGAGTMSMGGVSIEAMEAVEQSNYPLAISTALGTRLRVHCAYDAGRFSEGTIARLLEDYRTTIEWLANNPGGRIADHPGPA